MNSRERELHDEIEKARKDPKFLLVCNRVFSATSFEEVATICREAKTLDSELSVFKPNDGSVVDVFVPSVEIFKLGMNRLLELLLQKIKD